MTHSTGATMREFLRHPIAVSKMRFLEAVDRYLERLMFGEDNGDD